MLRYQVVFSFLSTLVFLWCSLYWFISTQLRDEKILKIVELLPMYAVVTFGAYSLATIGINLIAVKDCPEAAAELEKEIILAKEDLKGKGFKF